MAAYDSVVIGVGDSDREAYTAYRDRLLGFAGALAPFWLKTIPRLAPSGVGDITTFGRMGLNLRRLGKEEMREFLRVFSLPMRDLLERLRKREAAGEAA
ncbi:MAG: hypothetical protein KJO33_01430 [Gammaproteobacteria bacterium]|nr:hypothetical protein [Gammaproteobacteria bacterium]